MSALFSRNKQGERRVSPSLYKLLLTAHIIVAVGWLGVVFAKLLLATAALTSNAPAVVGAVDIAFPPLAIGTIVTGVLLSLGTKWGLLQHYWVATKLVLTVGVIVTAVQIGGRLLRQSLSAPSAPAVADGAILAIASTPLTLLIALSATHLLMLAAATVISVYKPWGKTWFGRRAAAQQARTANRDLPIAT